MMFSRVLAFAGLALAAAPFFAGCANAEGDSASIPPRSTIVAYEPDASDAAPPEEVSPDAPVGAQTFLGNSMCHASRITGCYPDDVIDACDPTQDAGSADSGPDAGTAGGCHVVGEGADQHTTCLASGYGMNSSCSKPTDCSAGHECVRGGTCRHYCCSGNAACSAGQFCDVQPTAQDPNTLVPVCMPQIPCTLLDDTTCPAGQQCTVVREDGSTSCVSIGPAGNGESCDLDRCALGLVCVGAPGTRLCATLCLTADSSPDSSTSARCTAIGKSKCLGSLPLFPDPKFGVCQ
jgi:hypothetical protein